MKNEKQIFRYLYRISEKEKADLLKQNFKTKPCICACEDFIIVLKSSGDVFIRRENENFEKKLGYSRVLKICGGKKHFVGLRANGTVFAMGSNDYGQCNVHKWSNIVDISAGQNYTVGMTADENILVTGSLKLSEKPAEKMIGEKQVLKKIEQTAALFNQLDVEKLTKKEFYEFKDYITDYINNTFAHYQQNILAALSDTDVSEDTAYAENTQHTAAENKTKKSSKNMFEENKIKIAVGKSHIVGVKPDGTVAVYGRNDNGECDVGKWKDIKVLAAGDGFTVGLKTDGTAISCGINENGQCNVFGFKNMIQIAAGASHTVSLRSDGKVVAVGNNTFCQCNVRNWKNIKMIAANGADTFAVTKDGRIVGCGLHKNAFRNVFQWKNIQQIALGEEHIVGLDVDGGVLVEGKNFYNDDRDDSQWKDIVAVAAGSEHIVALKSDGTVAAVGKNKYGECNVFHWKDIVAIAANYNYTFGLKNDGNVVGVGRGYHSFFKMYWKLRIV